MTTTLTKAGYKSLVAEKAELQKKLKDIAKRLKAAVAMGDLSENSAYITAREDLANGHLRLAEVEKILKNVQVIDEADPNSTAIIGAHVTLKINGQKQEFLLVNPVEANPAEQKLSTESAIGAAILGKKAGEKVTVETPGGKTEVEIVKVA